MSILRRYMSGALVSLGDMVVEFGEILVFSRAIPSKGAALILVQK